MGPDCQKWVQTIRNGSRLSEMGPDYQKWVGSGSVMGPDYQDPGMSQEWIRRGSRIDQKWV